MYNSVIFYTFGKFSWNYLTGFEMTSIWIFSIICFVLWNYDILDPARDQRLTASLFSSSEGFQQRPQTRADSELEL